MEVNTRLLFLFLFSTGSLWAVTVATPGDTTPISRVLASPFPRFCCHRPMGCLDGLGMRVAGEGSCYSLGQQISFSCPLSTHSWADTKASHLPLNFLSSLLVSELRQRLFPSSGLFDLSVLTGTNSACPGTQILPSGTPSNYLGYRIFLMRSFRPASEACLGVFIGCLSVTWETLCSFLGPRDFSWAVISGSTDELNEGHSQEEGRSLCRWVERA